ncbi:MAG: Na/Pi cotransporter family protein [Bacillota bacterium]|nr:Na/Pi cotransporter family protein [Bacillota bacterium]
MTDASWAFMAFGFLGGVGILLYGIQVMGDGLQKILGRQLRQMLESVTKRPVFGVLAGVVVTVLFQSSTATTVILVGLTSAAVITLRQCMPVILGADIGTTITAQLIALKFTELSLLIVGLGAPIVFFAKRDRHRRIGQAITGFGLLFLGLKIIGDTMHPLQDVPAFTDTLLAVSSNPVLAVIVAALVTFLVHSSAAVLGIVMVLATKGMVDLYGAIYLLLGANVGTSFTALLASIGSRREAQRVAMAHFLAKMGGTALLFPVVPWYGSLLTHVTPSVAFQVANAHTFFNVGLAVVFLPFSNFGCLILERLLPDKKIPELEPKYLREEVISAPSVAIGLARKETVRLSAETLRVVRDAERALLEGNTDLLDRITHKERVMDTLCKTAVSYLTRVLRQPLSRDEMEYAMGLIHVLDGLEKITDIVERNIKFLIESKMAQGVEFSARGRDELSKVISQVSDLMRVTHKALVQDDFCLAEQAVTGQPRIATLVRELRQAHVHRLTEGIKETEATSNLHLEFLTSYQQLSELVRDIAFTILEQLAKSKCCLPGVQGVAKKAAGDVTEEKKENRAVSA